MSETRGLNYIRGGAWASRSKIANSICLGRYPSLINDVECRFVVSYCALLRPQSHRRRLQSNRNLWYVTGVARIVGQPPGICYLGLSSSQFTSSDFTGSRPGHDHFSPSLAHIFVRILVVKSGCRDSKIRLDNVSDQSADPHTESWSHNWGK